LIAESIRDGVVIGGAGGAIAGLTVWLVDFVHKWSADKIEGRRVYRWLKANTRNEDGHEFRSTRAIASWNNLTEDRVREVCSLHPRIFLSTGNQEDMWSVYDRGDRSVYERRGPITI
jgi:hypothetical protein